MEKFILSISIPTYNRKNELKELLESILSINSEKIEVVVTDNKSTDDTLKMLSSIKDTRLKIYENEEAVPGYYNMILGLFNASGKYVMHCNDRDIIFPNRILKLIYFLEKNDFSYIQTSRGYLVPTEEVNVYEKGFDSLIHQNYSSHPTGMVFNKLLMEKYLKKETYLQYIDDTFTYCFLMRELLVYEKSAIYDCGCWNERHSKIKLRLKSGSIYKGGLYFEPERISVFMKSVIKHIVGNEYFSLTRQQERELIINIIKYFKNQLVYKKICYADNRECAHYGLRKKFIGIFEMKRIYQNYILDCSDSIRKCGFETELEDEWNNLQLIFMKGIIRDCLAADKGIVYKKIKRIVDPNYPY